MMRIGLRTMLPLAVVVGGLVLVGWNVGLDRLQSGRELERSVERRARTLGTLLSSQLESSFARGEHSAAQNFLSHASADRDLVGADLVSPAGQVLLSSSFEREGRPLASSASAVLDELGPSVRASRRPALRRDGDRVFALNAVQLESGVRGPIGLLLLEWDLAPGRAAVARTLLGRFLLDALIVTVAGFVLMLLLDRLWIARVERLVDASRRVGRGAARPDDLQLGGSDELAQIAVAMRGMLDDLRRSEARLGALIDEVGELILLLEGPEQRVRFASPSARALLGAAPEDLLGRPLEELIEPHPDSAEADPDLFAPAGDHERALEPRWGGQLGDQRVLVLRDVTASRALRRRVTEQQQFALLGRLSADVAHDFNNLLSVVQGYASLLELGADERSQPRIESIMAASRIGAEMCNGLLTLSHARPVQLAPLELDAALQRVVDLLKALISPTVAVSVDFNSGAVVLLDDSTLTQIAMNLIVNARQALLACGGGHVRLSTRRVDEARRAAVGLDEGAWVCFSAEDDGPGIPPAARERVFTPFYTTKGAAGSGLGLSIVREAAQTLGGRVVLTSTCADEPPHPELGAQGTRVDIYLPRVQASPEGDKRSATTRSGPAEPSAVRPRALLVEDEPAVREVVRLLLQEEGFDVDAVETAEAALTLAEQAEFEVLLTDHNLPGMSGLALIRELRARGDDSTLTIVSSGSAQSGQGEPTPPPGTRFLNKPFSLVDLRAVLGS